MSEREKVTIPGDNIVVSVNEKTDIPLVELSNSALNWYAIVRARRIMIAHWDTMEVSLIEGIRYAFLWKCPGEAEYVQWIPRASMVPTEQTIQLLRTVPGFLLADLINAMSDPTSRITTTDHDFTVDHDHFGNLVIG